MTRTLALFCLLAAPACSGGITPANDAGGGDAGPADGRLDATTGDGGPADANPADGTAGDGSGGDGAADGGALRCPDGRLPCDGTCCAAGTSCGGGFCCADSERCGGLCCGPGRRCEGNVCALDCGTDVRCDTAAGDVCCGADQVCYLNACTTPGATCSDLMRCPEGQYCEPTLGRCLPPATGEACEYRPPVGVFSPQLKWQWSGDADALPTHDQVMMQPVVASLNDDNGDGRVDHDDVPDIVFNTFAGSNYWSDGVLRAISGADGARIWPAPGADPGYRTTPGASIAIAELDATSPGPEVVTCSASDRTNSAAGHVLIVRADGSLLREVTDVPCGFTAPAVADLDHDGTPDIVVRNIVFHADGTRLPGFAAVAGSTAASSSDDYATAADVAGDDQLELVLGNKVLAVDGTTVWVRTDIGGGSPAVADLDRDGRPEIAYVIPGAHQVRVVRGADGTDFWPAPVEVNQLDAGTMPSGGGPPTVADFDGDGTPDVATAGGYNYLVLNGLDGSVLWFAPSQDHSSRTTGSSVFDFEGDGAAEAIYNDEVQLRVFAGGNGAVRFAACNTSGTLREYPVIVDVDNDDHADIVVMENNYAFRTCADGSPSGTGIKVYSDAAGNWVRTRKIWNQHTYHVTNVDDDGNVPVREVPNWTVPGLDNFRQNVQPQGLFDAPDLLPADVGADLSGCDARMVLTARVVNRGAAGAPAGVPVTFYQGDPAGAHTRVGTAYTTRRLLAGESEQVSVTFDLPAGHHYDAYAIYVVINDPGDAPLASLHECRVDNNAGAPRTFQCVPPG